MSIPVLIGLAETPAPVEVVGGKGAALMRLVRAGFPVPAGFVLTTAATARETDVLEAYARLGAPAVAVRSSAAVEDGVTASYAGQLESFLNVQGAADLIAAVRACRASVDSPRAVAYRQRHGAADRTVAVVVQEMVAADAAGVLFTAGVADGGSDISIEAVLGLGERLVSGDATPDAYVVARTGAVLHRTPAGVEPLLDDDELARLTELGLGVEGLFGRPVDVEWCRSDGRFWLVQARPITTLGSPTPVASGVAGVDRDGWNDACAGDFLWTNTNVGEAIPDVMTPLTWSMVQIFLRDAMATASIPPLIGYGRVGGRAYLNVSVMRELTAVVGLPERVFRRLTAQVFGRLPPDLKIPRVPASRWTVLRGLLPMAVHVLREARRDTRVLEAYLREHPARCRTRHADLAVTVTPAALARLWTEVLQPEYHRASWMLSAATRSSGLSFVLTGPWLERLVGPATANALLAGLGAEAAGDEPAGSTGRPGQLASLGLLEGLDRVAAGELPAAEFGPRYGHRGPHEFELSWPRPGEDPGWLTDQLAQRGPVSLTGRLEDLRTARDRAWAELTRRHPVQARVLRGQIRRWAVISRSREQARSELVRYLWVIRAYALRAGALTGLDDDVFFCSAEELLRVLRGETLAPRLLAERRAVYEDYCRLPTYPVLIRGPFDPFAWASDPDRRTDLFEAGRRPVDSPQPAGGPTPVTGFPGSAGVVTGRVRVLTDPAQSAALLPGEILVTTVTNVGWTPIFPRCGAVVTDVGAPLSHAAIVARELGIPAVVGCGNATMALSTGDLVRVDGAAGTVELI